MENQPKPQKEKLANNDPIQTWEASVNQAFLISVFLSAIVIIGISVVKAILPEKYYFLQGPLTALSILIGIYFTYRFLIRLISGKLKYPKQSVATKSYSNFKDYEKFSYHYDDFLYIISKLESLIISEKKSSTFNLSIGISTAGTGILYLVFSIMVLSPSDDIYKTMIRNFPIVFLTEVIAFFFLRNYMENIKVTRKIQDEINKIILLYNAFKFSVEENDSQYKLKVLNQLLVYKSTIGSPIKSTSLKKELKLLQTLSKKVQG